MNSSRRWLIIFAIVIGILVVATVALVLINRGSEVTLLPEDTPQGVVQRYLLAIKDGDYQKAYSYLSFIKGKIMTYDDWVRSWNLPQTSNQSVWKATLGKTTQDDYNASVGVTINTFRPGGLFEDPINSRQITFKLVKIVGKWVITSPTYFYWGY